MICHARVAVALQAGSVHVRIRRDADEQMVLAHVFHRLANLVSLLTVQIFKDDWSRPAVYQVIGDKSLLAARAAPNQPPVYPQLKRAGYRMPTIECGSPPPSDGQPGAAFVMPAPPALGRPGPQTPGRPGPQTVPQRTPFTNTHAESHQH